MCVCFSVQPLPPHMVAPDDLRCPAAKTYSITHAAAAPSKQFQTPPVHRSSTVICHHYFANHTTTASTTAAINNRCSHYNAICTPEFNFTKRTRLSANARRPHPRGSQNRRREPLCARKHRVSFDSERPNITLTQQFHCDLQ